MNIRTRRNILVICIVAMLAILLASAALLQTLPLDLPQGVSSARNVSVRGVSPTSLPASMPAVDVFAIVWQKELRKPVIEKAATTVAAAPIKLQIKIIAIMEEGGKKTAMVQNAAGDVVDVQIDSQVDGAKVTAIDDDGIDFVCNGQKVRVGMEDGQ